MFLQLHISEKTGRGVPTIISKYGKRSIKISNNTIIVTIPFNRINKVGDKVGDKSLNNSEIKVLAEIRNNPNVTKPQLEVLCNLGKTSIDNCISLLKKKKYIERVGARKNGYWKVIEDTNVGDKVVDKVGDKTKKLNPTRQRIMEEIRNNPNITQPQLMSVIGIGKTAIQNNIAFLRENGNIERVGSNKNGYWRVL